MDLEDMGSEDQSKMLSDDFEYLSVLGKGAFGTVVAARSQVDGKDYAVKVIQKQSVPPAAWDRLRTEAHILSSLNNQNIVGFKDIKETEHKIFVVMELVEGGSLFQLIEKRRQEKRKFADDEVARLMKHLIAAVKYLHTNEIVHRDLKPENILIHDQNDVSSIKIADFGLSAKFSHDDFVRSFRQKCGTMVYMAPELASGEQYGKPVDIWSCGLVMYLLLSGGKHPLWVKSDTPETFIAKLKNPKWVFDDNFTPLAQNFFLKVMNSSALNRYTADDCEKHPWITRRFNDEIPLSAHEVTTSFSHEISLARVIKALYITNKLNAFDDGLIPNNYKNLADKFSEEQSEKKRIRNHGSHKSILVQYTSIQSLLGMESPQSMKTQQSKPDFISMESPKKTGAKARQDSPSHNAIASITTNDTSPHSPGVDRNNQPLPFTSETMKSRLKRVERLEPVGLVMNAVAGSFMPSPILAKTTEELVPNLEMLEDEVLPLKTEPNDESSLSLIADITPGFRKSPSNRHQTHKSSNIQILQNFRDDQGFESDNTHENQHMGRRAQLEGSGAKRSPSMGLLVPPRSESSNNNYSYLSDASSDNSDNGSQRGSLKPPESQKITKKSPFFHNAQRVGNSPMLLGPEQHLGPLSHKNSAQFSINIKPGGNSFTPKSKQRSASKDISLPQINTKSSANSYRRNDERDRDSYGFQQVMSSIEKPKYNKPHMIGALNVAANSPGSRSRMLAEADTSMSSTGSGGNRLGGAKVFKSNQDLRLLGAIAAARDMVDNSKNKKQLFNVKNDYK